MIARADVARDAGRSRDAGLLYAEALRLMPPSADIHLQAGHMFKEGGDHPAAERHYGEAQRLAPQDAETALQLGHFYKVAGRLRDSELAYRRAVALKPRWAAPLAELDQLARAGWRGAAMPDAAASADELRRAGDAARLAPETAPLPRDAQLRRHGAEIVLRHLGRRERSHWGLADTLRGTEAIRGFCISATPIVELQITIGGQLIWRGPVKGGYPLAYESDDATLRKYVFNVWLDLSGFVEGRYELAMRCIGARGPAQSREFQIVIAAPLSEAEFGSSDGLVTPDPADPRSPEAQINARPSMVRPSPRRMLAQPPRNVLVIRADQLGDVVVSLPAMRRLRELLPGARLVGLVSPVNCDLARSLGMFDEQIVVEFPDDPWERRRVMPIDQQQALRTRLAPYAFDMAIDLSENDGSRPLLALSGAPVLCGFRSGRVPEMTIEVGGDTHDRIDRHEVVPHTNKLMGVIEWIGAMLGSHFVPVPRMDLPRDRLKAFGIGPRDRYVALHTGARNASSRWPGYVALAALIVSRTDLKVVLFAEDLAAGALPAELSGSGRLIHIDGRLPFDDFDAILSYCAVLVGNDSGPKHLASLRGAKVVSVHMARNNWNEWGQEGEGFIVSRKVPCAGCLIQHDPEECGKDFVCITQISAEEIFDAVAKLI